MSPPRTPRRGPDRQAALAQYERRARVYDIELVLFEPIRRRAVSRLDLRPGQLVLDIGCGTGLSLPLLRAGVGAGGRIVGIEQSPHMLELARRRVAESGWSNVTLVCAPVETAELVEAVDPARADAALFHFTHDVLRNPAALGHVARHLDSGARVVAAGLKWAPPWAVPVNLFVWAAALRSVTSFDGLDAPWSGFAELFGPLEIETLLGGGVYLASGALPAGRPAAVATTATTTIIRP